MLPKSLVGEADVKYTSTFNLLQKGAGDMNALNPNDDFRGHPHPTRYRITDGDGKAYASFRLKPGVTIAAFVAKYIPIAAQDDWSVTEVRR